jgi:hypothetical protein
VADPRGVLKTQGQRAPGNREEEKTLTTGKMKRNTSSLGDSGTSLGRGKPWTRGDGDTTREPIQS